MRFPGQSYAAACAFAAAVLASGVCLGATEEAGVAAAVNADSQTLPPEQQERTLVIGHKVVLNERITTGELGQAQILMLDQSAVTVASSSTLVIDRFVYDPDTRTGEMALSLSRGLMRFVGGRLSKSKGVEIRTPVATMGVRGGIAVINVIDDNTVDVTLLFGETIEGTTKAGEPFAIRRNGYFTRLATGRPPAPAAPAGARTVAGLLGKLQGRLNATAGAPTPPTGEGAVQQMGQILNDPAFQGSPLAADAKQQLADGAALETLSVQIEDLGQDLDPDKIDVGDLVDGLTTREFELAEARLGDSRQSAAGRVLELTAPGVDIEDPDLAELVRQFDVGDRFFVIDSPVTGRALASPAGFGQLAFSENGVGDPNAVPNIFDPGDPTLRVSPALYNQAVASQIGAGAAQIFAAQNVQGGLFFNYDLTSPDFNGVVGTRQTIFGGAAVSAAAAPSGRTFYEPNQDSQTLSLLPFSEIGRFRLPDGAGFAGTQQIEAADIAQTPVMIDWDRGKMLYLGGVFHKLPDEEEGPAAFGFQTVVGTRTGDPVAFVGKNAGSTHFEQGERKVRLYHTGLNIGTPLGVPGQSSALSLDGAHATLEPTDAFGVRQDTVTTENHQFGVETKFVGVGAPGVGVEARPLFAGGIIINDIGDLEVVSTDPDAFEGVGALRIDRNRGEAGASFRLSNLQDGDGDIIEIAQGDSAFFDDDHFAMVHDDAFREGGSPGVTLVSGEPIMPGQQCKCEFMNWGFWAGAQLEPDGDANSLTDVGVFFAGAPTIDMPIGGQATFNGQAFASVSRDGDQPAFARGNFQLNVNFANGVSVGSMNLAQENFSILGNHAVGQSALGVRYIQDAQFVGTGSGGFFGPGAANVGVTINIDGNGVKAGGAAIGER